ncbi:hypothetical protein C8Q80DRAFT_1275127 [Daedaleopsis nitida]|nr:hypothetical protein C8Q80DRAFT_1275127 [Daedaleopsis nitida]
MLNVFLIDVLARPDLTHPSLRAFLGLLSSEDVIKVMWDGRSDAVELRETHGITLRRVLDLPLVEVVPRTCTDIELVTTEDGAPPTPHTASPLHGVAGRGSIVLFSQASIFQLAELGDNIQNLKAQGKPATCDNEGFISSLHTLAATEL